MNKSPRGQGIKKYLDERGLGILAAMDKVAAEQNVPVSQIAVAWLLHKPYISSAIASATSAKQLSELIHATGLKLSDEQMAALDKASAF